MARKSKVKATGSLAILNQLAKDHGYEVQAMESTASKWKQEDTDAVFDIDEDTYVIEGEFGFSLAIFHDEGVDFIPLGNKRGGGQVDENADSYKIIKLTMISEEGHYDMEEGDFIFRAVPAA